MPPLSKSLHVSVIIVSGCVPLLQEKIPSKSSFFKRTQQDNIHCRITVFNVLRNLLSVAKGRESYNDWLPSFSSTTTAFELAEQVGALSLTSFVLIVTAPVA